MKKKIMAILLAAAMTMTAMTSCTVSVKKNGANDVNSTANLTDDASSEDNSSEGTTTVGDITISNAVGSGQIAIDGKLYTLPCKIAEFLDDGWTFKYADEICGANTKMIPAIAFSKDDNKSIKIMVQNFDMENEHAFKDCYASSVEIYADGGVEVILPRGVKFDENLTIDLAKEVYGEVDYEYNSDKNDSVTFDGGDVYAKLKITIYKPDSNMTKYSSVCLENGVRENIKD